MQTSSVNSFRMKGFVLGVLLMIAAAFPSYAATGETGAREEAPAGTVSPTEAVAQATQLELVLPESVRPGELLRLSARLVDDGGNPLPNQTVTFYLDSIAGALELAVGRTNASGLAIRPYLERVEGRFPIRAEFAGDSGLLPSSATGTLTIAATATGTVVGRQLPLNQIGVTAVVALLIGVWATYALALYQVVGIGRSRQKPAETLAYPVERSGGEPRA